MRYFALALLITLLLGCAPKLLVQPWPCVRIEEAPVVDLEMLEMKRLGTYRHTREWAVAQDAKCAADRVLAGQAVMRREPELSWWEKGWVGRLLRRPERE